MRQVVVTAVIGKPDFRPRKPKFVNPRWDYILFSDKSRRAPPPWQVHYVPRVDEDPCRDAKRFKMLPHEFLPKHDYHLWIDAHCVLVADPQQVVADEPLTLVRHWCARQCIRTEAQRCIERRKAPEEEIREQIESYGDHPPNWGLWFGGFIGSHNTEEVRAFRQRWYDLTAAGSIRDQLALPVALRETGIAFHDIGRRDRGKYFSITKNA